MPHACDGSAVLTMELRDKERRLRDIISGMRSVLIAFSAGADSTLLLKAASMVLPKDKILAVTAYSATYPKEELLLSRKISRALDVRHKLIKTRELEDRNFTANTIKRCYFCKRELFRRLADIAKKSKLDFVADASSVSDRGDFRPGSKARKQSGVRSPLEEAGFNKGDIRSLSRKLGLVTWDKPAMACLASRIPYGVKITAPLLERVNSAENFLRKSGFLQVRLRHYNGLCRIEVPRKDIRRLIGRDKEIVEKLKKLGYNYITVDLQGYRTGSLNEVIKR